MLYMVSIVSSSKRALVLMILIAIVTIIDSQFVNTFYGTNLGSPSNLHLLLFGSFVIVASIINNTLLFFTRKNYISIKNREERLCLRTSYIVTSIVQYAIFTGVICRVSGNGYFSWISARYYHY